jgi:hypothetical protein
MTMRAITRLEGNAAELQRLAAKKKGTDESPNGSTHPSAAKVAWHAHTVKKP